MDANLSQQVHLVGTSGSTRSRMSSATPAKRLGNIFGAYLTANPAGAGSGSAGNIRCWRSNPSCGQILERRQAPDHRLPVVVPGRGRNLSELRFGELGYAREARASYLDFCVARERGELPRHLKFQVCLPTPMGVAYSFCTQRDLGAIVELCLRTSDAAGGRGVLPAHSASRPLHPMGFLQ